ncbi:MAG: glycosyltransferase [Ktedonobacterales bacterium]|nr:glycosyltransferase [Ktedonobacterales bacterium]
MRRLVVVVGLLALAERAWKHAMVMRFFRRPVPAPVPHIEPVLVSILQPILSGDPTLPTCLERNLRLRSRYAVEYLWLVDTDDPEGQRICWELAARYPRRAVRVLTLPPPGERQNPKLWKLIQGARVARGEVLCVLDDDTQLPDDGLEQCLPYLDEPGVGLAFGLPYYINFANVWSRLVAYFVNSHSLLTYVPYTAVTDPFTINGMFYAVRRETLEAVGGFAGLEATLADDFAVAQRFRTQGYRLAQTPLCHGISTQVEGPGHYLSLIQRWFIFPRESLLRHTSGRERVALYGLGMLPTLLPPLVAAYALARPSRRSVGFALAYFGYSFAIFAHFNRAYLRHASPWRHAWMVPAIELAFPFQLLTALLAPKRLRWRGHLMRAERGGGFHFIQRRGGAPARGGGCG